MMHRDSANKVHGALYRAHFNQIVDEKHQVVPFQIELEHLQVFQRYPVRGHFVGFKPAQPDQKTVGDRPAERQNAVAQRDVLAFGPEEFANDASPLDVDDAIQVPFRVQLVQLDRVRVGDADDSLSALARNQVSAVKKIHRLEYLQTPPVAQLQHVVLVNVQQTRLAEQTTRAANTRLELDYGRPPTEWFLD